MTSQAVIYLKHGAMLHAPTGQTYTIRPGGTITFKNSVMVSLSIPRHSKPTLFQSLIICATS